MDGAADHMGGILQHCLIGDSYELPPGTRLSNSSVDDGPGNRPRHQCLVPGKEGVTVSSTNLDGRLSDCVLFRFFASFSTCAALTFTTYTCPKNVPSLSDCVLGTILLLYSTSNMLGKTTCYFDKCVRLILFHCIRRLYFTPLMCTHYHVSSKIPAFLSASKYFGVYPS